MIPEIIEKKYKHAVKFSEEKPSMITEILSFVLEPGHTFIMFVFTWEWHDQV